MIRKKAGRQKKRKVIDVFVEKPLVVPDGYVVQEHSDPPSASVRCECGETASLGSYQCWKCAHRP